MTAKIDWYREVLELEPNSKVFFPLARLLAEEGNEEEAMGILERGLMRHPEYLEARLFRIELLFREGRRQECNAEIEKLSKMFASYGGFWQAWAACLASDQSQSDTASVLRFLAAHFVSGPLKLHEVLNRGLDAMLRDGSVPGQKPVEPELPQAEPAGADLPASEPAAVDSFDSNAEAMLDDLDAALAGAAQPEIKESAAEATEEIGLPGEAAQPVTLEEAMPAEELPQVEAAVQAIAEQAFAEEVELPESADEEELLPVVESQAEEGELELPEPVSDTEELPAVEEQPEQDPAGETELELPEAVADDELLPAVEAQADQNPEKELELPQPASDEELLPVVEETAPDGLAAEADLLAEAALDEQPKKTPMPVNLEQAEEFMVDGLDLPGMDENAEESQEESISLRTRSMAEVLAEQGDIQGALDIYAELAEAATSSDEAEDINRRIATLKSRLDMANSSAGFSRADEETAEKNREKLIGMLEALAQRVEARAQ